MERTDPQVLRIAYGWYTVAEAASMLGLHRGSVRGAMDSGTLPYAWLTPGIRVIHRDDIARYLAEHRQPSKRGNPGPREGASSWARN